MQNPVEEGVGERAGHFPDDFTLDRSLRAILSFKQVDC